MKARRLGIVGRGAVFEKLYAPALRRLGGFQVVGVADPVPAPGDTVRFDSMTELLDAQQLQCVAVLSPPGLHGTHVALALERGLGVLVEKPPTMRPDDCDGWNSLVTPAFSRRYWRQYARPQPGVRRWRFVLQTNPSTWGARNASEPLTDLLPHAIDLARWLSGREIGNIGVSATGSVLRGEFGLGDGVVFEWEVGHGAAYVEYLEADGAPVIARPGIGSILAQRMHLTPERDVAGVVAMLSDWTERLDGGSPVALATTRDGLRCVEVLSSVQQLIDDGSVSALNDVR